MKKTLLLALAFVGLFAAARLGSGQAASAAPPAYVDENQPDPAPLKLIGLEGQVRGLGGDPMPMVSVALFTEDNHQLVSAIISDRQGKFRFEKVAHGLYRVVARVQGLCTANIPVKVEGSPLAGRKLIITMRPKDIDTCSYGMAKR